MQTPEMNLRIEMFGNLVLDLNRWHDACEDEGGDELVYCEQMFIDVLTAVRDMRETLLEDFDEYKRNCKANHEPVDLGYHRVHKQLQESTFSLVRG